MARSSFWETPTGTVVISAGTSVLCVVLFLVVLPFVRPQILRFVAGGPRPRVSTSTLAVPTLPPAVDQEDELTIRVVKKAEPAVVAILVQAPADAMQHGEIYLEDLFNPEPKEIVPKSSSAKTVQIGGGSGFFVSPDGLIATNKHVVNFEGATFTILTHDGRELPARLLATDPILDLAILKVEGNAFPYLEFADSDALVPGQTVIAIGNALDEFRNTITKGVVSGLNRRIVAEDGEGSEVIEEAIQTDAAINPGNSGGPLIDLSEAVVGINTAVSERGQLLGFALPSNVIRRVVESVRRTGRIVRPFLGVRYQIITKDLVDENQLPVDFGALVIHGDQRNELAVAPGSPADKAGIVENDILLEFDGVRIDEVHSLSTLISRHAPGDEVSMVVMHAGERKTVKVTLEELKLPTE
jgi:2-alkenal reductase